MKKNNWIILAVASIAAAVLLWLWFHLGFNKVDAPLDLVLAAIWWAGVVGLGAGIHKVEKTRQERVRTCYVTDDHIFNSEAGKVAAKGAGQVVDRLCATLDGLQYGMDIADMPTDAAGNTIQYDYVVRSKVFDRKVEKNEDDTTTEKLQWEGEVAVAEMPHAEPLPFNSREELLAIMGKLLGTPAAA